MMIPNIYNFGAGPGCLPAEILSQIVKDIPDWYDGMSVMEVSHRLPVFVELTQEIERDFRQLLSIPEDFALLFMHGGARSQFAAVPLNLLHGIQNTNYLLTGHWSELAFEEAKKYCHPHIVASSKAENYTQIPDPSTWVVNENAAYIHYTDNETIHGVEFPSSSLITNRIGKQWLVSDMTSNLLTKPIDFSPFGLIYASTQKNLGIAGLTVVIVRKSLLGKAHALTPSVLNYSICEQHQSMYNTPAVFCWYVLGLVLKWAIAQGGISTLSALCQEKSQRIYNVIDANDFYICPVVKAYRSRVNIPFRLQRRELESLFLHQANELGLKQLQGHKTVGACRASLYNAMPMKGVDALVEFMQEFAKMHA
jgi:phosphoserine aminotransferase